MNAVPRGGRDSLPPGGILSYMAGFAALIGNDRMRTDFIGTLRNPHVHLARARKDRLLMTGVAGKLGVLALATRHLLVGGIHHVASVTEFVRMLRVIPGGSSGDRRAGDDDDPDRRDCESHRPGARRKPASNAPAIPEEQPQNRESDNDGENGTADLHPLRNGAEKKAHNRRDATGQKRFHPHRIHRCGVHLLKRRGRT
jgi:hypothetical protein